MEAVKYFNDNASNYLMGREWGSKDAVETAMFFFDNKITIQNYLDIGSGPGCSSLPFLKLGVKEIVGVDSSLNMLHLFTKKMEKEKEVANTPSVLIKTVQCDFRVEILKDNIKFACVGAFGLLNYLTYNEASKLLKSISLLITQGGYLCFSLLTSESDKVEDLITDDNVQAYKHPKKLLLSEIENAFLLVHEDKYKGIYIMQKK